MLTSARQRAQRVRLGQLVNALRTEQDQEVHASAFDSAAAGSFGCLDPDTACLLLCRLLQVDDYQDSIKGDVLHPPRTRPSLQPYATRPTSRRRVAF